MQELRQYAEYLKNKYRIDDEDFTDELCEYLITNDWFSVDVEQKDGKIFIDDEYLDEKLEGFLTHYQLDIDEKIEDLYAIIRFDNRENADYFKEYAETFGIDRESVYYLLNFMVPYITWPIKDFTNSEIDALLSDAIEELSKGDYDILVDFLIWCSQEKKTVYKKVTKVTIKKSTLKEAYDLQTYGNYLFHFFNEDYIKENKMYEKALDNPKYAKIWLYICVRLICAVRNTDLVRIPHPKLNHSPEVCLERIKNKTFDDYDAKMITGSITIQFEMLKYVPNKTKRFDNVPNIQFFIPTSLIKHFGILFAIVESQMELSGDTGAFIEAVGDYNTIKKHMGIELSSLFRERNLSAIAASKSFMQIICESDDLVDVEDEFKLKGYYLAGLARSHKGSYGEFQRTTIRYLKDNKLTGKTPEVVARELFERGSLSFILVFLLKIITGKEYNHYSAYEQTKMIQNIGFTPLMAENAVGLVGDIKNSTNALMDDVLKGKSMDDIVIGLHRVGNGDASNKEEGQCILTALGEPCPKRETCVSCPYSIGDEFAIYTLTKEAKRLAALVKSGVDTEKNTALCKALLTRMDEFLNSYRTIYGKDAANVLTRIIEENTNGI